MAEEESYLKKAVGGARTIFIFSIFSAFIAYLTRLVLAKNLSVEDFGLFYAVIAVILTLVLIEKFGLGDALVKFIPEFNVKKRKDLIKGSISYTLIFSIAFAFLLAVLLIVFSDFLAVNYFHSQKASIVLKIFAIFLVFRPFSVVAACIFQGFKRMDYFASMDFLRVLIILVACAIGFNIGKGILIPTYAYLLMSILLVVIFVPFILKIFPDFLKEKALINKPLIKKLHGFGFPVILSSGCSFILGYIDTMMLTYFSGLEQVGLYNVANPTAHLLAYFGEAVATVVLPFASELWAGKNIKSLQTGIDLIYKYAFLIILPFAIIMFSFPELIISFFFGASYVNAAISLKILAIGMIFLSLSVINGKVISGIGKPSLFTRAIFVSAVFNIIFNWLLIPKYGIAGASVATSTSYLLMFFLTSYSLKKFVKNKIPLFSWFKTFIAAVIFVVIINFLKSVFNMGALAEAAVIIFISTIAYAALVLLFGLATYKEIKDLIKKSF